MAGLLLTALLLVSGVLYRYISSETTLLLAGPKAAA